MSVRATQLQDVNKMFTLVSEWLHDIQQNMKSVQGEGPFNDLNEKKVALSKFRVFLSEVHQHSEMVNNNLLLCYVC